MMKINKTSITKVHLNRSVCPEITQICQPEGCNSAINYCDCYLIEIENVANKKG